jgi:plasmid stabilization system protein ParE
MKCKVVVTDTARAEFRDLHANVMQRFGKRPAVRLKAAYRQMLKNIASHAHQYPAVEGHPYLRKCVLLSLTIVYYRVEGKVAEVLSVHDGRQRGPDLSD